MTALESVPSPRQVGALSCGVAWLGAANPSTPATTEIVSAAALEAVRRDGECAGRVVKMMVPLPWLVRRFVR
jgi:hypothetical protein